MKQICAKEKMFKTGLSLMEASNFMPQDTNYRKRVQSRQTFPQNFLSTLWKRATAHLLLLNVILILIEGQSVVAPAYNLNTLGGQNRWIT